MRLYHISSDVAIRERGFVPRVPMCISDYTLEDTSIPRICFSDSVDGCFTGMPREHLDATNTAGMRKGMRFTLYTLTVKKNSAKNKFIIGPKELERRGLVYDAMATGEHWVLTPVYLRGHLCELENFSWSSEVLLDKFTAIDIYKAAMSIDKRIALFPKINITNTKLCYRDIVTGCAMRKEFVNLRNELDELLMTMKPYAAYHKFYNVKFRVLE